MVLSAISGCFGCQKCEEVFCEDYLSVRFLSKADGSNLFSNGTYDSQKLKLFGLDGDGDISDYTHFLNVKNQPLDNVYFYFQVSNEETAYIFEYDTGERDTLQVRYDISSTDCCDQLTNFSFGIFQGDTIVRDVRSYLVLTK